MDIFEMLKHVDNPKNVEEIISILQEDCVSDCIYEEKFYDIYATIYTTYGNTYIKQLAHIAMKYESSCPNAENIYQLYYIIAVYYYSAGDYAKSTIYISKFTSECTLPDYALTAHTLKVNMLHYLGMDVEAEECLNELIQSPFVEKSGPYTLGLFFLNTLPIMVKLNKKKEAYEYLSYVVDNFNKVGFDELKKKVVILNAELYVDILFSQDNTEKLKALAEDYKHYIFDYCLYTDFVSIDSETFLEALDVIAKFYDEKTVYEIIAKYIKDVNPVFRDKINFYNYLYDNNNKYYKENEEMRNDHLSVMHEYYSENRQNVGENLKEIIRLQLAEERLNILESKYNVDSLTNCYNRNYLIECSHEILNNKVVVYFDLDDLKLANDTYGHDIGDLYLIIFAKLLKKAFTPIKNKIYRYGGDEFVVVSSDNYSDVLKCLDELQTLCQNARLNNADLKSIGFSSGIYVAEKNTILADALVLADKAMYSCKKLRKNKETIYYLKSNE